MQQRPILQSWCQNMASISDKQGTFFIFTVIVVVFMVLYTTRLRSPRPKWISPLDASRSKTTPRPSTVHQPRTSPRPNLRPSSKAAKPSTSKAIKRSTSVARTASTSKAIKRSTSVARTPSTSIATTPSSSVARTPSTSKAAKPSTSKAIKRSTSVARIPSTSKVTTPSSELLLLRKFLHNAKSVAMSSHQRRVYMDTLMEFDRIWRVKQKRAYFIMGGSLLGSYRHSGSIPFDDDLDIAIPRNDRSVLHKVMRGSRLEVKDQGQRAFKVYFKDQKISKPTGRRWRWPFLDVWPYDVRGDKLQCSGCTISLSYVFPTIMMPFNGHLIPAPRCPLKYVLKELGKDALTKCCTPGYNHQHEHGRSGMCTSCSLLRGSYYFTEWERLNKTHVRERIRTPAIKHAALKDLKVGLTIYMPKCE